MASSIEKRARFDLIRYANCWEDARVLRSALLPAGGKRILSIGSGGDNSFALLADGAAVVAADLSIAQLALIELKAAAIRRLTRREALEFLGVEDSDRRGLLFEAVRGDLSTDARQFWAERRDLLAAGVIHAGKFEGFFRVFHRRVLPWVHGKRRVEDLLARKPEEERHDFYERHWNTRRWRWMFRLFFSRFVMGRLGRDPEFFRYVEGSVADRILERTRYAFTVLPTHNNPYLEYVLTGRFRRALPPYLEEENWEAMRDGLDRLTLWPGTVADAATAGSGRFDGFNLSDIFEYLDPDLCRETYATLLDAANPGARFAYWNMLVPRSCPPEFLDRVESLTDQAEVLLRRDRAFFYRTFVLEVVR